MINSTKLNSITPLQNKTIALLQCKLTKAVFTFHIFSFHIVPSKLHYIPKDMDHYIPKEMGLYIEIYGSDYYI